MAQLEGRKIQPANSLHSSSHQPNAAILPPSTQSKPTPLSVRLMRGLLVFTTLVVSATVGLATALVLPLPSQLATNDKGPRSLTDLFEGGLPYQVGRPVNILVMGIDRVPNAKAGTPEVFAGRSDTLLLLRVDPNDDSVNLLSIPRDTQVEIPGVGVTKVNDANVRGGAKLAAKTVSRTLNGVKIDRYIRVSTNAFRELVDLLGGVQVYVPTPMSYEDKTQKLKINLATGWQTLNGDQAEQFARFRGDGYGDIGRVQRQQVLLKALLKRLTDPTTLPRIPALIGTLQQYIDTNLSTEELLALLGAGQKISQGNFKMVLLPGRFSEANEFRASYWIMNVEGRDRVLKQYFKLDAQATATDSPSASSLRIAVQNASGQPNVGNEMRKYLTSLGFDNVYVAGDWTDPEPQTQIIVQQGDLNGAKEVQKSLGFGAIEPASVGELESDLTIRVGKDWLSQPKSESKSSLPK